MPRCNLCFKEKTSLQPPIRKFPAEVCKGCFYEIDRVIGFLEHYGFMVEGQTAFPQPKKRTKPKSRAVKSETSPSSTS